MNELVLIGKVSVIVCQLASLFFLLKKDDKDDWKKSAMTLNAAVIILWLIVIAG